MNSKRQEYQRKFEKQMDFLNTAQKKAVDIIDGPVAVIAGPGTGKTQILTLRIANIMDKLGADMAENILALTFTNAGVHAMKERLSDLVGTELAYQTGIYTFHSFAESQIQEYPEIFSNFAFSRPITDIEKIEIIEEILHKKKWNYLQTFSSDFHYTKKIIAAIDDLKSEAISPEDLEISILSLEKRILKQEGENAFYKVNRGENKKGDVKKTVLEKIKKQQEKQKELVEIYYSYQQVLKNKRLYDFSDTILSVVKTAQENETFKTILQEKYLYILVDEHQDTNTAQNTLIEIIAAADLNEGKPNIFTVGDEKQAIYRFQGASLEEFEKFKQQYADVEIITLENNYRSSQNILDSAHALLKSPKQLQAKHPDIAHIAKKVSVVSCADYTAELIELAEQVALDIKNGTPSSEIAIFYKENKNLDEIKNILSRYNIPYVVSSKENILDSLEIKKLILLLRAVDNPVNDEVVAKALFIDFLGFDTYDIAKILEKFSYRQGKQIKNKSVFKIISSEKILSNLEVTHIQKYIDFTEFLKKQKKLSMEMEFLDFFSQFVHESGFLSSLIQSPQNTLALARWEKIFNEIKNQTQSKSDYGLENFLAYIEVLQKYNISVSLSANNALEGVNLMTAHASKGLEFESVYITNFIDNKWGGTRKRGRDFILPVQKTAGDIDDERRLFYVALTRGKKKVIISHSQFSAEGKDQKASRFLEEIGEDLIIQQKPKKIDLKEKIEKYFTQGNAQVLSLFDKKYIKKLFLQNTLSISAFNNYKQSPIKYFFRNLVRLPAAQTKPLIFGNVVHDALDSFFKQCKKEKKILSEKILLDFFVDSLEKFSIPEKYFESIRNQGEEVLKNYWREHHKNFSFMVETEKRMFAELVLDSGEKIKLYGIVDKMEMMNEGKIRVVDYKTGKTFGEKNKEQKADLERQLVFYKLLIDQYFDANRVEEAVLDFVEVSKKTGKYVQERRYISQEQVEELKQEISEFAHDILSGDFLDRTYEKNKENEEYFELWELLQKTKQ